MSGFFIGALIPLPAVQAFCFAAGIAVVANWAVLLFGMPAILAIEARRCNAAEASCAPCAPLSLCLDAVCCRAAARDNASRPRRSRSTLDLPPATTAVDRFVHHVYAPALRLPAVKAVALLLLAALLAASAFGAMRLEKGLDVADVVPESSYVYDFISTRYEYFNLMPGMAVVGDIDYPRKQAEIRSLMAAVNSSQWVIPLAFSWIDTFLNYLAQYPDNYTLTEDGLVPPELFYEYWEEYISPASPSIALAALDGVLEFGYARDPSNRTADNDSQGRRIVFSTFPFYTVDAQTTEEFIRVIEDVRAIFEASELESYPSGQLFTYWEQYVGLTTNFWVTYGYALGAVFAVTLPLLVSPVASLFVALSSAAIVAQIYGLLSFLGIKFSAIPAVSLIMAIGLAVEFTAHFCVAFEFAPGTRDDRMVCALRECFVPVINGGVSSFVGFVMLAFAELRFIFVYFFALYSLVVGVGLLNGLLFLPVMLSLVGPPERANAARLRRERERGSGTDLGVARPATLSDITEKDRTMSTDVAGLHDKL